MPYQTEPMPNSQAQHAVTIKGRVPVIRDQSPTMVYIVDDAPNVGWDHYLGINGKWRTSAYYWPSREAAEAAIAHHADALVASDAPAPASPPASDGKNLPDATGVWTRNGRTLVVREMLDDPGTWRLRGFDANTGVEVEISEQWSPLKGGWHPASAAREDAQAARLAELEAELAKVREENAHLKKSDDLNHELLASYERQLGITPADDTGTIGSRIDDLKSALTALRSAIGQKAAEWRAKPWHGDRTAGAFDCADELEALAKEGK